MKITWSGFAGANIASSPRIIAPTQCVESVNQRPMAGELAPWRAPVAVATLEQFAIEGEIYRMGRDSTSDSEAWIRGEGSFMRGFNTEDPEELTYNLNRDGLYQFKRTAPQRSFWRQAYVPAPSGIPQLLGVASGTSSAAPESIRYVTTIVKADGRESAPSMPSEAEQVIPGSSWALTVYASNSALPDAGEMHAGDLFRFYRTKTGAGGDTNFYWVGDAFAQLTGPTARGGYLFGSASLYDNERPTGDALQTIGWIALDPGSHHLTALWGGMACALRGKSVRFCEINAPYAWPLKYEIALGSMAVSCAAYQQTLVVGTTDHPHVITGSDPANMMVQRLEINQSVSSPRSMVSVGNGVVWASPDGLVMTGTMGTTVLTDGFIRREQWQALPFTQMAGAFHDGKYFAIYPDGGFWIDTNNPTGVFFFERTSVWGGMTNIANSNEASLFSDPVNDALFIANHGQQEIYRWDAGAYVQARAKSRQWRMTRPTNFAALDFIGSGPATIDVIGDGEIVAAQTIEPGQVMRIPVRARCMDWQIKLVTSGDVQAVRMAQSVAELISA